MSDAYIIDAVRTPRGVGKPGKGALSHLHPQQLAATVLKAIKDRNKLDTATVDDIIWSTSTQEGKQGGDLGRMSALAAGYDTAASGTASRVKHRHRQWIIGAGVLAFACVVVFDHDRPAATYRNAGLVVLAASATIAALWRRDRCSACRAPLPVRVFDERCPACGRAITAVVDGDRRVDLPARQKALAPGSEPLGLFVDAEHLYWTQSGTGEVMQAGLDGSNPVILASGQPSPVAVQAAGGFVYWVSYADTGVARRAPIGGGEVVDLAPAPAARDLFVGAEQVWWTGEPDDLWRAPLTGVPQGTLPALLSSNALPNGLAVDAFEGGDVATARQWMARSRAQRPRGRSRARARRSGSLAGRTSAPRPDRRREPRPARPREAPTRAARGKRVAWAAWRLCSASSQVH